MRASLYLHIPFCRQKCSYCDFNSFDSPTIPVREYVSRLLREMAATAERFAPVSVPTVYFGGGTPSLLPTGLLTGLLVSAAQAFELESDAEITLEANPGTVTLESLGAYLDAGVNRLSVGIQSLDDRELAILGRIHTADQGARAIALARSAGFANIGLDLMHSLPGQTLAGWRETLSRAVDLGVEHISAYALSIEDGTPLAAAVDRGDILPVDPDLSAEMFEYTADFLVSAGYEYYEVSNFARPGRRSRHNQVYWQRGSYLGFGAGAHSFLNDRGWGVRWENPPDLAEYAASFGGAEHPLSREDAMAEFFFLGLRMLEGVDLSSFAAEFGEAAENLYADAMESCLAEGVLQRRGDMLALTRRGLLLANRVLARFI